MHPRQSRRIPALACALATIGAAGVIGAHDTWLLANSGHVPVGGAVSLAMSSGGHFPVNETAILPARVAAANWRLAGESHVLATGRVGTGALQFRTTMPTAGVATFWVSLHPKVLTLKPSLVAEYTSEIGAPAEFLANWRRVDGGKWLERYSKHAKSFVRVGPASADSGWAARTGQPYELVPLQNPVTLSAGDTLGVLALRCGKPLANVAVAAAAAGGGHGKLVRTDASGHATVTFTRAGRWLVSSTSLGYADRTSERCEQPVPGDTVRVGYVSEFATMTLDVARRAR